jgi:GNAT superfamily N-acetyltransferase
MSSDAVNSDEPSRYLVRQTEERDFEGIRMLSQKVYPNDIPWTSNYLRTHLDVFPEGQVVVVDTQDEERVVGMAASLIIRWGEYDRFDSYNEFTDDGFFTNHDSTGRTLYGAEVMVDPGVRGAGLGSMLYEARRDIVRNLGLLRIRAGARLPGYAHYADSMKAEEYVRKVVRGELSDPTLSFQIKHGFRVLAIVPAYQVHDPKSGNAAALIEWLNRDVATIDEIFRHDELSYH